MRPKCPKCGKANLYLWSFPIGVACDSCGWSRLVSRAAIIRLSVEPKKPETCKWRESPAFGFYPIECVKRGRYLWLQPKFCEGCGKPVGVVNG